MKVARYVVPGMGKKYGPVPEGLIDSRLAVYCLGRVEKAFRPVRDGMIDLRGS